MRIVPAAEVHRICDWHRLVEALMDAHRGPPPLVDRSELHAGDGEARATFLNLPAWQPGVAMGTKIVTVMPANRRSPAGSSDGAGGLCAVATDSPARRLPCSTARPSPIARRPLIPHLVRGFSPARDARILLMVGAGALAPFLIAAHRAVPPSIEDVVVWNRDRSKAERLARACGGRLRGRSGACSARGRHRQLRHLIAPAARQGRVAEGGRAPRPCRRLHA